jgi:hypothetical protein
LFNILSKYHEKIGDSHLSCTRLYKDTGISGDKNKIENFLRCQFFFKKTGVGMGFVKKKRKKFLLPEIFHYFCSLIV